MSATIAFHAPLKSPDDPVPSGDRTMARLFLRALETAGFRPELATRLRLYDGEGTRAATIDAARREAEALCTAYLARPAAARPVLWFSYHVYFKAPDVIGPLVARRLGIPYVVAEGSRAPKRAKGPWAEGHALAEAALDAADAILILNERDREVLTAARPPHQRLVAFPPFLDPALWPSAGGGALARDPTRLLAVAMMRPGDKLASYGVLARALSRPEAGDWSLDIVGDGPARPAVEALFRPFGARVRWHGALDGAALGQLYGQAGALVWPAINEAFGMVFLEAALHGCPAVAGDAGGVRGVVRDGETGIVVPAGDDEALAVVIADLARPGLSARLGAAARRFVLGERTLAAAAERLRPILETCLAGEGTCAARS